MLAQRAIGAAIVVVAFVVPLVIGGPLFLSLIVILSALAVFELGRMFEGSVGSPLHVVSIGLTAIIIIDAFFQLEIADWVLIAATLGALTWLLFRTGEPEKSILSWALTLVGPLYIGWPLSRFVLLRELPDGLLWAAVALLGTWASDTGAYFVGRLCGRHKLYPRISPAKTWEGAVGGIATPAVVVGILLLAVNRFGTSGPAVVDLPMWILGITLGLLIGLASTIGDLGESLIKRGTGVKDASRLIPGHGGILDRLDSLVFSVPLVYYYVVWLRLF